MDIQIKLNSNEEKDLKSYCKLNKLEQDDIVKKSYLTGFNVERYGLLPGQKGVVEKEVIKEIEKFVEVPVEVIREVVKIEYVEVPKEIEKIVEVVKEIPSDPIEVKVVEYIDREVVKEVIKEVPVEKVVEKIVNIYDNSQIDELLTKIQQLESENEIFSTKRTEMENIFQNEKNDLLLKIQHLETKQPEVVEVIKEVIIEKEVDNGNKAKLDALQQTVMKLRQETLEKDKQIKELEKTVSDIQKFQEDKKAVYLNGSNLDKKMYK
jgi:hypothetical protein